MRQDYSRTAPLPSGMALSGAAQSGNGWLRRLLALLLLAVLAVPLAVICLLIRLDSPGPALFVQTRIGLNGRPFRIFKLRTMACTPTNEKALVTRAGLWMRRFGIDELPQLINVVKGDMALIGPRPLTLEDSSAYLSRCSPRFDALPGITGLAQATGRQLPPRQRERLDRFYVRHQGIGLDIQVLWRTLLVMRDAISQDRPD